MTELTLTEFLKEQSKDVHDDIDHTVMSKQPFESQENYKKFLQVQHKFHEAVRPIYDNAFLKSHIAQLSELSRFSRTEKDLADLGVSPLTLTLNPPGFDDAFDDKEAIGWLYCVEGSNVGAAVLYKHAGKIELDENFGASHLAAHPDGRMPHWRHIKSQIDAIALSDADKEKVLKGTKDAFTYFKNLLETAYA